MFFILMPYFQLADKITKVTVFCYQNCSNNQEKLLKLEAEGREFAKFLKSLEQFTQGRLLV